MNTLSVHFVASRSERYNGLVPLPPLRQSILTGVALIGGTLIIGAVIALLFVLSAKESLPEDLLPARQTIAVLRNVDAPLLARLRLAIPALGAVPSAPDTTVALLQVSNGEMEWITFRRQTDPRQKEAFAITGSERVRALIGTQNPLSDEEEYRQMLTLRPTATWVYIRSTLTQDDTTHPLVRSITSKADHLAISRSEDSWQLQLSPLTLMEQQSLSDTMSMLTQNPVFSLRTHDMNTALTQARSWTGSGTGLLVEGLVRGWLTQRLGPEASPLLSSLLHSPSTLHIGTASGQTVALLQAQHTDAANVAARLHELARKQWPGVDIIQRSLSDQFEQRDVRLSESALEETTEEVGRYTLRVTTHAASRQTLATVVANRDIIVSNDASSLRAMIEPGVSPGPAPRTAAFGSRLLAEGNVHPSALSRLLPPSLLPLLSSGLDLPWMTDQLFRFALEQHAIILSLTVTPDETGGEKSPIPASAAK